MPRRNAPPQSQSARRHSSARTEPAGRSWRRSPSCSPSCSSCHHLAVYSSFFRQVSQGGGSMAAATGQRVRRIQNFQYVITSGKFWTGVGHVLLYTVVQVPIMIIAALALLWSSIRLSSSTLPVSVWLLPALRHPRVVASIIWVYLYNGQISPIVKGLESIGIHVDFFANNVVLGPWPTSRPGRSPVTTC